MADTSVPGKRDGIGKDWDNDPVYRETVEKAKNFPRKAGRPEQGFGPVITAAVLVMRDAGLSQLAIAKELKINPATVAKIYRRRSTSNLNPSDMVKVKEKFSEHIVHIVDKMLLSADTHQYVENLATSKNPGLIQALSILIEKLHLLQGKPTNIVDIRDTAKLVEDKLKEITDLEAALTKAIVMPENPKTN